MLNNISLSDIIRLGVRDLSENRLAYLRQNKTKLSQRAFARLFNVAQNTISQWEQGKREMCADRLIIFADYFDVSIDYLVGRIAVDRPFSGANENAKVVDISSSASAVEKKLLVDFRGLSAGHKTAVLNLIGSLMASEPGSDTGTQGAFSKSKA